MNTPEWFGTIGVMNSQHLHRRGVIGLLRRAVGELGAAAAGLRIRRVLRPSQQRPAAEARPAIARPGRVQPRSERGMLAQQPARSA
jgi:hypothetical protein